MDHAIIMAGGSGRRLWPMSRKHRPKQLLPLVEGRNLMGLALDRLRGQFPPQRTWVITNVELVEQVRVSATHLPPENVIGEPTARDTSNAIGMICQVLLRQDPDARVGIFTADHIIRPVERFTAAVADALALLDDNPDALVTLGVLPTHPHTGLGYIRRGEQIAQQSYHVAEFVEKPDRPTARRYLDDGNYYWNSGMFIWRASTLIEHLRRFRPEHAEQIVGAADAWLARDYEQAARIYGELPRISIDYALMEPAAGDDDCTVLVRELDTQWLDLGDWQVLSEVNDSDDRGNLTRGRVATIDANGNILISEKADHLLATIGIEDMVVVHSGRVTLVAPKARAQDLKSLFEQVQERFGNEYE
jgi:mannose-1-phosphate guanylyltransferase